MYKKPFILILALSSLIALTAAAPILFGISAVSQQITRAVVQKAIQRGFSPSDPRVMAVAKNVQNTINSRVLTTLSGKETAVALAAITGLTIALNDNQTLTLDGNNVNLNEGSIQGMGIYDSNGNFLSPQSINGMSDFTGLDFSNHDEATQSQINDFFNTLSVYQSYDFTTEVKTCGSLNDRLCIFANGSQSYQSLFVISSGQTQPRVITNPLESANQLPEEVLDTPISDQVIADLTNDIWSEMASSPGYDGVPYQFSNPVTPTDVANTGNTVTVNDFVTVYEITVNNEGDTAINNENIFEETPETTVNETDFGPDPGIGSPEIETVDASSVLNPILSLLPDFRNFSFTEGNGCCPELRIVTYFFDVSTTTHCELWQIVKPIIHLTMTIVWLFFGIRIVLEA